MAGRDRSCPWEEDTAGWAGLEKAFGFRKGPVSAVVPSPGHSITSSSTCPVSAVPSPGAAPPPGPAMGNRPMGGARCSLVPAEGPPGSCLALMLEHHRRRAFKQPRLPSRPGRLPPHPPCGAPSRPGAAPRGQLLPMRPWAGAFPSGGERAGCRWQELIKVGTAQAPGLRWLETPWAPAGCGGGGKLV